MNGLSGTRTIMINIHNFKLHELTHTDTGYDNFPDDMNIVRNIVKLTEFLQVIRNELKLPVIVNSGYRSTEVNKAVGGSSNSFHTKGLAADIRCSDMDKLLLVLKQHLAEIDQLGIYYNGKNQLWYHIGLQEEGKAPRNQVYVKEIQND